MALVKESVTDRHQFHAGSDGIRGPGLVGLKTRWTHDPSAVKYFRPVAYLVPLNLLEEFSKPLSLSFRLLGNILADELTLAVLYGLVPIAIPIPVFLLGLFTSGIQALVFATLTGAYLGE